MRNLTPRHQCGRRLWMTLAALCCATWVLAPTHARAQAATAGFTVRVIEGSKAPAPKVDPKLADLKRELETLHQEFNTFALVGIHPMRLGVGQRQAVKLPDGAELALHLLELVAGPPLRVRHQLELPKSRTVRSVAPGGRTLDVRPWGDKLIIICTAVDR
ncbi:MAG: hypothetical protein FJ100_04835 [Deltaproteobacteria bacterium]|nr:hypothetical protein [Deltaproteobacteria bacterium]